ncbi:unnamed protein product [Mytilus coruscus]|uniref:Failed axon connections homolog n=1 Tax=Mytilus coruscus TaxID=42192 RepID=A0A6J7ZZ59_MYTCO|nr:unnamed protein product [Mytilus coruscus]
MEIVKVDNLILIAKVVSGTVLATAVSCLVWKRIRKPEKKKYPRDTVILHQISRGPFAPSISQYVMKLETYLRFAKIPYMNVHGVQKSKKGKYPWIEYNGQELSDTESRRKFSAKERGAARAFQKMLEENTFWTVTLDRWLYDSKSSGFRLIGVPAWFIYFLRRKVKNMTYAHGIGRHSQEEVYHILDRDLHSLSDFIGTNKFLLGDEPCQEDCAVFGQLSQIYWHAFGNKCKTYLKKYDNLCDYCERMKARFWQDWDQCITKGMTQKATK